MSDGCTDKTRSLSCVLTFCFPFLCGCAAFLLYEISNAQGLFWGDCGEFIAASNTLGIGHAYGHPLFWLVGRISILLHPSNPAVAMTHMTSLVSAVACGLVALFVRDCCDDRTPVPSAPSKTDETDTQRR